MDYAEKYANFLKGHASVKRPTRIICDSSNGTTGLVLKKLVGIPNLEFIFINETPDPEFPAHGPNPLITGAADMLSQKVLATKADLGVVFDADGDRAFFVDDLGRLIPSYITSAIWFRRSTPPFVADEHVYLSLTTTDILKKDQIIPARVGSIFIKEAMRQNNALLGAEFSGHFYFKEFFGVDSGIFAMIYTLNILSELKQSLSQLHTELTRQALVNIDIKLKNTNWEKVKEAVRKETQTIAKEYFEREGLTLITENGWINVRSSNTEPLVRITTGAKTKEQAEQNLALMTKIVNKTDGSA